MKRAFLIVTLGATLFPVWLAAQNNPQPSLVIDGSRVMATHFSPGSAVVFFSVYISGDGYSTATRSRVARVTDDDHDGSAEFDDPGPMPLRSVWIAVDERNGDYALACPKGYLLKTGSPLSLRRHANAVDEVDRPGIVTYLLYVHPGKGVWIGRSDDGGKNDADGRADYVTSLALSSLRPVVADNPDKPSEIVAGGTLLVIDASNLRTFVTKVTGAMLNGAH